MDTGFWYSDSLQDLAYSIIVQRESGNYYQNHDSSFVNALTLAININTDKKDLAYTFIEYMLSTDVQTIDIGSAGIPINKEVYANSFKGQTFKVVIPNTNYLYASNVYDSLESITQSEYQYWDEIGRAHV